MHDTGHEESFLRSSIVTVALTHEMEAKVITQTHTHMYILSSVYVIYYRLGRALTDSMMKIQDSYVGQDYIHRHHVHLLTLLQLSE